MGMIRFHESFEGKWGDISHLLQQSLTKGRMLQFKNMDTMVCEVVGSRETDIGRTFVRLALAGIPLHRWSIGLVVCLDRARYISIDMNRVDYKSMFDVVYDNEKYFKRCLVYVAAYTADHVSHLVQHPMYTMEKIAVHIDLEDVAMDAAQELLQTGRPEAAALAPSAHSCSLLHGQTICNYFSYTDREEWAVINDACATYVTVKQESKGHKGGFIYKAGSRSLYVDHKLDGHMMRISTPFQKHNAAHITLQQ